MSGIVLLLTAGAAIGGTAAWLALRPGQRQASQPAPGRLVAEPAHVAVVDSVTLRLHDHVVRLAGIRPPQRGSLCQQDDGVAVACAVAAANALAALVQAAEIDCDLNGHDNSGRPLATCDAGDRQLNRTLVVQGWARAADDRPDLISAERTAQAAENGLWAAQSH